MKCPGQDTQYWKPGAIFDAQCPECGTTVEFFKDDTTRRCPGCGHRFLNPQMDFGCASYCPYAEQCIGDLPPELLAQKEDLLKDRVAIEMKRYFKSDFKRIGHASRVARYAERIGKEVAGNLAVILVAAYLQDIGSHRAGKRHGSPSPQFQKLEGPPIARDILEKLGASSELIEKVCDIIAHRHDPLSVENLDYQVVYDADRIANLEEAQKESPLDGSALNQFIEKNFLTEAGRKEAYRVIGMEN